VIVASLPLLPSREKDKFVQLLRNGRTGIVIVVVIGLLVLLPVEGWALTSQVRSHGSTGVLVADAFTLPSGFPERTLDQPGQSDQPEVDSSSDGCGPADPNAAALQDAHIATRLGCAP